MDYAVIMAGGSGKRLWPLSREHRPKQMLRLLSGQTLLRRCFDRLCGLFDPRNILVVTNAGYVDMVRENLLELPTENVIAEPLVRDTAGAIGLAATVLHKYDPHSTMAVVTADQVIEPDEPFQKAMQIALDFVEEPPRSIADVWSQADVCTVRSMDISSWARRCPAVNRRMRYGGLKPLKKKPDAQTAKDYVDSGQYCWNSGMFVWKTKTILDKLHHFLPACVEPLQKIQLAWGRADQEDTLREWFTKLPKISIDYAVMEKTPEVYGIPLDCCWRDLGSFTALADIIKSDGSNNIVAAEKAELLDCKNSIIVTEDTGHLIALIGVENMVVAHSPDATLICPTSQSHRIKELLEQIQQHGGQRYL